MARPPKFNKKDDLRKAVDAYFDSISRHRFLTEADGEEIRNDAGDAVVVIEWLVPPSETSLCMKLGITKKTWCNYAHNDKLKAVVEYAKARIEEYLEQQLMTRKNVRGIIFNLQNNYGWREKTEVEVGEQTRKQMTPAMTLDEKLAAIAAAAEQYKKNDETE